MVKAIMFGGGASGEALLTTVQKKYEVIAFTDNDASKWGKEINGIRISSPQECFEGKDNYLYVIVTSTFGMDSIINQCLEHGITEDRIVTSYIEAPVESRRIFLKKLAQMYESVDESLQCAEAGVFTGDFAKYINEYFPKRILHLFDTFEGFDIRDINKEKEAGYSDSMQGDYCNNSVELVLSKMVTPEHCRIHKGYFPETTKDIMGKFIFVNLDMDLYEPTYAGLYFFGSRMANEGVILIHDYFATEFKGPKAAVDQYTSEHKEINKVPIGDGCSILLTGFENEKIQ